MQTLAVNASALKVSPASDFVHQAASDSVISCGPDGHARDDALMDIDPQYPVVSDEERAEMLKAREELLAEG